MNDKMNRRTFLQTSSAATAFTALRSGALGQTGDSAADASVEFRYPELGRVAPVASKSITASPLGVGFETLDRKQFDPARAYEKVGQLGVKWARCQTGWARTERKPGKYDFQWLDDVVDSLMAVGVQPWLSLSYGNPLYTPKECKDNAAVGWVPTTSDEAKEAWQRYVTACVERYSDRVQHFEMWNEVNVSAFWKPLKSSPQNYMDLVTITSDAIRAASPGAKIIGGAFSGMPHGFLQRSLELGLGNYVDIISHHPYGRAPEFRGEGDWGEGDRRYEEAMQQWHALIDKHDPELEVWQGECGLPSHGGKGAGTLSEFLWTEEHQAKWLPRRILMDLICGIEMTSYFTAVDLDYSRGSFSNINYKGLLRYTDYTPKPAYLVYQCLCSLFDARTKLSPANVTVRETGVSVENAKQIRSARFVRDGKAIFGVWYPSLLPESFTPSTVTMDLPIGEEAAIREPVLIDPMSQKVFRLAEESRSAGSISIAKLPLVDYPLLITDRSVALP